MSQKIAISKVTFDVLTETNPDNLTFSSDYGTLKYYASGNVDITIIGNGTDKTTESSIVHGLGYVPVCIVYVNDFVNDPNIYNIVPYAQSTISINREAEAWADTDKLYFYMRNKSNNTYTAEFYYKIFINRTGL